jgi:hypothetical protein
MGERATLSSCTFPAVANCKVSSTHPEAVMMADDHLQSPDLLSITQLLFFLSSSEIILHLVSRFSEPHTTVQKPRHDWTPSTPHHLPPQRDKLSASKVVEVLSIWCRSPQNFGGHARIDPSAYGGVIRKQFL